LQNVFYKEQRQRDLNQNPVSILANATIGMRDKARQILDVFWTPFDIRFSNILDRLSKHEKLLELEWTISEADINLIHANLWERELESIQIKQKAMAGELETLKMNTMCKCEHLFMLMFAADL